MALVAVNVFISMGGESIPPFTFQIAGAERLIIKAESFSAESQWFSAGWINAYLIDSSLPTFETLEKWSKLPLGNSLFLLPNQGIYNIKITPQKYLRDLRFLAWT